MPSPKSASRTTRAARPELGIVAALLLCAAALTGCGGDDSPPEVPRPAGAEAERQRDDDGAATLRSAVRVQFPDPIELALEGDELLDSIRIQTPGAGGLIRPERVPVASATVAEEEPEVLVVETSELVPRGSEFRIQRRALAEGAGGSIATTVDADLSPVQVVLASRPVEPVRPELFIEANVAPVVDADRDEAAMREELVAHLERRGTSGPAYGRALEYFDTMPADIVTTPKLGAALAALAGTFAEIAIDDLLGDGNCTGQPAARIAFEEPPDFPDLLARVTYTDSGARVVSINPRLEGEAFQLLMPILMHEAIHCDRVSEVDEEIAATAFDTFFYILLLAVEPWIAQEGTVLSQNFNVDALAMMNSGRMVPESLGILESPGGHPVFPGTELEHASFADYVRAAYAQLGPGPSPEEQLAQQYVSNLAEEFDLPVRNAFNLEYLDGLLGWSMDPEIVFAAMDALGLEPMLRD